MAFQYMIYYLIAAILVVVAYFAGKKLQHRWWFAMIPFFGLAVYYLIKSFSDISGCGESYENFCGFGGAIYIFQVGLLILYALIIGAASYNGYKNTFRNK